MIAAGQAHGTRAEDIYGCLYFYLFDRLRLVKDRLRRWNITVNVSAAPIELVPMLVKPEIKFHRIEVANMVDYNYSGVDTILRKLSPLLHSRPGSTIISYFMNWIVEHPAGDVKHAPGGPAAMMAMAMNSKATKKVRLVLLSFLYH